MVTIKNFVQLRFILFFLFFLSFTNLFSQDTIVFINGQKTLCKVIEVGINEIKYKEFSNPEGPLYIKEKSDIKEIIYKNGVKESFNIKPKENRDFSSNEKNYTKDIITSKKIKGGKIYYQNNTILKRKDLLLITEPNEQSYSLIKNSLKYKNIGLVVGSTSGILMGVTLGSLLVGNDPNWKVFGIGAGLIPIALIYGFLADSSFEQGVEVFNNSLLKSSYHHNKKIKIELCSNNIGILIKF